MKTTILASRAPAKEKSSSLRQSKLQPSSVENDVDQNIGSQSGNLLATQGWCVWRCAVLGGEHIMVVDEDMAKEIPAGYPVYTVRELERLTVLDESAIRLVHIAKKESGARVIGTHNLSLRSNRGGAVDQDMY